MIYNYVSSGRNKGQKLVGCFFEDMDIGQLNVEIVQKMANSQLSFLALVSIHFSPDAQVGGHPVSPTLTLPSRSYLSYSQLFTK